MGDYRVSGANNRASTRLGILEPKGGRMNVREEFSQQEEGEFKQLDYGPNQDSLESEDLDEVAIEIRNRRITEQALGRQSQYADEGESCSSEAEPEEKIAEEEEPVEEEELEEVELVSSIDELEDDLFTSASCQTEFQRQHSE